MKEETLYFFTPYGAWDGKPLPADAPMYHWSEMHFACDVRQTYGWPNPESRNNVVLHRDCRLAWLDKECREWYHPDYVKKYPELDPKKRQELLEYLYM
ncbi:hypothetical protein Hypma_003148 [Hypsizygus marmoreus]|uniref:Uncharacterized protein n=1 Tax=Hypsizygus marmoreus TaxID=39966 RepID=A0A369K221_HYPMA|nr:hypothetical protein Hypma_003148 [Hypsizygus marmoreus]